MNTPTCGRCDEYIYTSYEREIGLCLSCEADLAMLSLMGPDPDPNPDSAVVAENRYERYILGFD